MCLNIYIYVCVHFFLQLRYESLDESVFQYRCYAPSCAKGGSSSCYSPLCRAKTRTRDKLINSVKNYTIVTSKPSPYALVGSSAALGVVMVVCCSVSV